MIRSFLSGTCLSILLFAPTVAAADEADALAALSKPAFLEQYEAYFVRSLEVAETLLVRLDPEMGTFIDTDTPVRDVERASFECAYDYMADAGTLTQLAQQILLLDELEGMVSADQDMDYADLVMNETLLEQQTSLGDGLFEALSACDAMEINSARYDLRPELWGAIEKAGRARGYITDD